MHSKLQRDLDESRDVQKQLEELTHEQHAKLIAADRGRAKRVRALCSSFRS